MSVAVLYRTSGCMSIIFFDYCSNYDHLRRANLPPIISSHGSTATLISDTIKVPDKQLARRKPEPKILSHATTQRRDALKPKPFYAFDFPMKRGFRLGRWPRPSGSLRCPIRDANCAARSRHPTNWARYEYKRAADFSARSRLSSSLKGTRISRQGQGARRTGREA